MRLIDLDQTVFVPIVDESKGGVSYEMQMSLAEFFDKFLDGFKPEVVDAIPVEWINALMLDGEPEESKSAWRVLKAWKREQEAHDVRTQTAND